MAHDRHFTAGVGLAVDLLRAAQRADDEDLCHFNAETRGGAPQAQLLRPVLDRLAADPALLPGFEAVLVDILGQAASEGGFERFAMKAARADEPLQAVLRRAAGG